MKNIHEKINLLREQKKLSDEDCRYLSKILSNTEVKDQILIVDDQLKNIQLLGQMLQPLNCKVRFASDYPSTVNSIENRIPDLILLDIRMPEMNGFEIFEELKKIPRAKSVPVFFVTGLDKMDIMEKVLSSGAAGIITKPLKQDEVIGKIQQQLLKERERYSAVKTFLLEFNK